MNKVRIVLSILSVSMLLSCETKGFKKQKLTGINTRSYTDAVYTSNKDTVIVSTFSGRISRRVKGSDKEQIITHIDDEVYSLAFVKARNEIIASTMSMGVVIVDAMTGEIKKKLSSGNVWINNIYLSDDGKFLTGLNGEYESFIWSVSEDYKRIQYPEDFPKSYVKFGKNGVIYHITEKGELLELNPETMGFIIRDLKRGALIDVNEKGDALLFNHNKLILVSTTDSSKHVIEKHPDWPIYSKANDTIYREPYHLKLSNGCITTNIAFTGSIDRSIRLWDVRTGELKGEILKHKATISGMAISKDESQMVSVDLKGGIHFYTIK